MMGTRMIKQVKDAIGNLNPHEVRDLADRPVSIELYATNNRAYEEMEGFFAPSNISEAKRCELRTVLHRAGDAACPGVIEVWEQGVIKPPHAYIFYRDNPHRTVEEILKDRPDLRLALARHIYPFRAPVVTDVIHNVLERERPFLVGDGHSGHSASCFYPMGGGRIRFRYRLPDHESSAYVVPACRCERPHSRLPRAEGGVGVDHRQRLRLASAGA